MPIVHCFRLLSIYAVCDIDDNTSQVLHKALRLHRCSQNGSDYQVRLFIPSAIMRRTKFSLTHFAMYCICWACAQMPPDGPVSIDGSTTVPIARIQAPLSLSLLATFLKTLTPTLDSFVK